jgi:prepilin-type N-terminal cleavage/methylation domain-containing protein
MKNQGGVTLIEIMIVVAIIVIIIAIFIPAVQDGQDGYEQPSTPTFQPPPPINEQRK